MPQLFANNAASTLAAAITAAGTSLTLAAGTGSKFPSPAAGDFFLLTLTQAGQETSWEIVKVTARAGDVLTVVRAQEGGVAAAWGIGAKAELRITAGALDAKQATLVSGTNIKTINGASLLGAGDLGLASSKLTIDNKTSNYTVVASDLGKIINCTGGSFTVSLTAAATLGAGFNCWIWNTSNTATHSITIDPNAAEGIDGVSTLVLKNGEGVQIVCDGTGWQTGDKKAMRGYAESMLTPSNRPVANGVNSVALGESYAAASGSFAAANGGNFYYGVAPGGLNGIALGLYSRVDGRQSVCIGTTNYDNGYSNSTLVGYGNDAGGINSVGLGTSSKPRAGQLAFASGAEGFPGEAQVGVTVYQGRTLGPTTGYVPLRTAQQTTLGFALRPHTLCKLKVSILGYSVESQAGDSSLAVDYVFVVTTRGANAITYLHSSTQTLYKSPGLDCSAYFEDDMCVIDVTSGLQDEVVWVATVHSTELEAVQV